jgi:hypothetical protein
MTAVRPVQSPLPEQDTNFDADGIDEDDYIETTLKREWLCMHTQSMNLLSTNRSRNYRTERKMDF